MADFFQNFDNWYGVMIALAVATGVIGAALASKKKGFGVDVVFDIVLWAVPLAIVGARLYYVIFSGRSWTFLEILGFNSDGSFGLKGLAIYGGVIGALLGVYLNSLMYRRKEKKTGKKMPTFFQMCDIGSPFLILGQAIGRWGNFFNQEVYGQEITNEVFQRFPFAIEINGHYYQALFFYESLFNLIGFALLLWFFLGRRRSFSGFVFALYGAYYGLVRLVLESFRQGEFILRVFGIPVSQLVSVLMILAGVAAIIVVAVLAKKKGRKVPILVTYDDWPQTGLDMSVYGEPLKADAYEYIEVDDEESVEEYVKALKSGKVTPEELKKNLSQKQKPAQNKTKNEYFDE